MTRPALFAAVVAAAIAAGPGPAAEVPVAPAPRPAGVEPRPAKAADPAAAVERIIQNSRATADRLAKADTGTATRKLQDETLALIDSLLDQSGNPPPSPPPPPSTPDQKPDSNQQDAGDDGMPKEQGQKPKDGKPDAKSGKGSAAKQDPGEPKGSGTAGGQPMQQAGEPKEPKEPKEPGGPPDTGPAAGPKPEPMPGGGPDKTDGRAPKDDPKGGPAGGVAGKPADGKPPRPSLSLNEEVAKQVWGHLRERERQQAMQWFNERYMPKYEELMNLYFSSLGDRRPAAEQRK